MQKIAPLGPVYQAGTLSGNPVAMTAGLKTLELIAMPGFFDGVATKVDTLVKGMVETAGKVGIALTENHLGGMFGLFFTDQEQVTDFAGSMACDQERFRAFFHAMLERGVYLAPSAFEAGFVSAAHSDNDIAATLEAARASFAAIA
jgi:glutamate-1-semialdehyde 2,1-aminomutase